MAKSSFRIVLSVFICGLLMTACFPKGNIIRKGDVEVLADKIWEYGLSHPEGFTIDIYTMESPLDGIAVSYSATQGSHSRGKLNRVLRHAIRHDGYVGGWFNDVDSLYYFDSTRLFPEDSIGAAIKFGFDNGQRAIYNIGEKREIKLD